jgi:hypothetical protein
MSTAPEPYLSACLEVIYKAILRARSLSFGEPSKRTHEEIEDMTDAVHNLPHLLTNWERCDRQMLVDFLRAYDRKWPGGPRLVEIYEAAVGRSGDAAT